MSYDEHLISMAGGDGEATDQLAAIEARAHAATEGPWETHDGDVVQSYDIAVKTGEHSYEREGIIPGEYVRDNDAEFIAHARTDVPALLALVRDQQAKLYRANELVRYLDRLAPGDKHYAGLIRAAITATEEGK